MALAACEPTIFVASFDNVDPGASHIAPNLFALDQGVVDATLGEIGVSVLDHLTIPPNLVLGVQECLDRCGIDRSTFNFRWAESIFILTSHSDLVSLAPPSKTTRFFPIPHRTARPVALLLSTLQLC